MNHHFWQFPRQYLQNTAVITQSQRLTYGELQLRCNKLMSRLPESGSLVALLCQNNLDTLVAWLACLNKGVPVMLLDANTAQESIEELLDCFCPAVLLRDGEVVPCYNQTPEQYQSFDIDPRLAAMISTSGSTGSAKQVALSYKNLQANARSICQYLPIQIDDTTITTLPFHYSYGLSVINTHLLAGAAIVLSNHPVTSREFWEQMSEHRVNSLAGVPHTWEMLKRLGFLKKEFPALRYATQAGGRLADDLIREFADYMQQRHKRFYVMYGQTEATARMAWLSPEKLPAKLGSIGSAIPGGRLSLVDENKQPIQQVNTPGELVYSGDNVMLGYASGHSDLIRFTPDAQLFTGDLAVHDADGDYFITGRAKRFVKIFGNRTNLDEVESILEQRGYHVKVTGTDKRLYLALLSCDAEQQTDKEREVIQLLSKKIKLHPSAMRCATIKSYPLKANQKTDYSALLNWFENESNNV